MRVGRCLMPFDMVSFKELIYRVIPPVGRISISGTAASGIAIFTVREKEIGISLILYGHHQPGDELTFGTDGAVGEVYRHPHPGGFIFR